jgi:hypothetical protein
VLLLLSLVFLCLYLFILVLVWLFFFLVADCCIMLLYLNYVGLWVLLVRLYLICAY